MPVEQGVQRFSDRIRGIKSALLESRGFYPSDALGARALLKFWIFSWVRGSTARRTGVYMQYMRIRVRSWRC